MILSLGFKEAFSLLIGAFFGFDLVFLDTNFFTGGGAISGGLGTFLTNTGATEFFIASFEVFCFKEIGGAIFTGGIFAIKGTGRVIAVISGFLGFTISVFLARTFFTTFPTNFFLSFNDF